MLDKSVNLNKDEAEAVFKEEKVFIHDRAIHVGERFSLLISIKYFVFYEMHISAHLKNRLEKF